MIKPRLLLCSVIGGLMAALLLCSGGSATAASTASSTATSTASSTASHGASLLTATSACVPNVWTQVHWYVNPFWPANYRYQVDPGVFVKWRWFSGGVPPYWENSFTTVGDIWAPPSFYTSVEFMCSSPTLVTITPL